MSVIGRCAGMPSKRQGSTYWEEASCEDIEKTGLAAGAVAEEHEFALHDFLAAAERHRVWD